MTWISILIMCPIATILPTLNIYTADVQSFFSHSSCHCSLFSFSFLSWLSVIYLLIFPHSANVCGSEKPKDDVRQQKRNLVAVKLSFIGFPKECYNALGCVCGKVPRMHLHIATYWCLLKREQARVCRCVIVCKRVSSSYVWNSSNSMEMKYLLLHTHTHPKLPSNIRLAISSVAFVLCALQRFRLEIPNI